MYDMSNRVFSFEIKRGKLQNSGVIGGFSFSVANYGTRARVYPGQF